MFIKATCFDSSSVLNSLTWQKKLAYTSESKRVALIDNSVVFHVIYAFFVIASIWLFWLFSALNYFTGWFVLIYYMLACMYQVQEFHHLGMVQLLMKGTCKLLINPPSSIVIQVWGVMKHWSTNLRLFISACMSLGVWFCVTWSPQSHTSNNNCNFWYCIHIVILLFNREFYPKTTWFLKLWSD